MTPRPPLRVPDSRTSSRNEETERSADGENTVLRKKERETPETGLEVKARRCLSPKG